MTDTWPHPVLGDVMVVPADRTLVRRIYASWHHKRFAGDQHNWKWCHVYNQGLPIDVLVDTKGAFDPAAAWTLRQITVAGQPAMRLHYVEVNPDLRGRGYTWQLSAAIIAETVVTAGVHLLVLGAIRQAAQSYADTGAKPGKIHGWPCHRDLVPFSYDRAALEKLAARAAELKN